MCNSDTKPQPARPTLIFFMMSFFDNVVGLGEEGGRNGEPERPGGREIDAELEAGRLLDRHVGRLLTLEDAVDKIGGAACDQALVRAVGDEDAGIQHFLYIAAAR